MSFEALADAEYAREVGRQRTESAWVLSDRDVWYRNPFYTGPAQPHPEDYSPEEDEEGWVPMPTLHSAHVSAWIYHSAADLYEDLPF